MLLFLGRVTNYHIIHSTLQKKLCLLNSVTVFVLRMFNMFRCNSFNSINHLCLFLVSELDCVFRVVVNDFIGLIMCAIQGITLYVFDFKI